MQTPIGVGLLALSLSASVLAAPPTTLTFNDNETLAVTLSSLDINRLVVKDDKITSIVCPTGFCTMPALAQGSDGEGAPIDPQGAGLLSLNVQEPFTLYITTEKGHSFGAFIRPLAVPAVTTVFLSTEPNTKQAEVFEKTSPYTDTLASLIKAMINNRPPEGYLRQELTVKKATIDGDLRLTPLVSYQGAHLLGVMYRVSNQTSKTLDITAEMFAKPNVKALSISTQRLAPHSSLYLYQVLGGAS